ncbi:hypothetical protein KGY73_03060 [bacterium]|nr:hypothetical protein [bacterium]
MNELKKGSLPKKKEFLSGFTLIEVLISFSLIIFLLMGMAQLILYSLRIKTRTDCGLISTQLASSKLATLKSLPFEGLRECSKKEIIKEERTHKDYHIKWKIQEMDSTMKKIEITCYTESFVPKKAQLVLFLCKELRF